MKLSAFSRYAAVLIIACSSLLRGVAQDTVRMHIDPSKPSNLYTRLSNNIEYNFRKGNNTYGYRGNFVWASRNKVHALHLEFPLLYSTATNRFGVSDIRFRYFWVPYKNYAKSPATLGATIDTYAPTGRREFGLGSGRWIISPGISTGFVFGKFSTFPIFSYLYTGPISDDKVTEATKKAMNGFTVQTICVVNFNEKSYLDFTPTFLRTDFGDTGSDDFRLEGNFLYMIKKNKWQVGGFARRTFRANVTTVRASARLYF